MIYRDVHFLCVVSTIGVLGAVYDIIARLMFFVAAVYDDRGTAGLSTIIGVLLYLFCDAVYDRSTTVPFVVCGLW